MAGVKGKAEPPPVAVSAAGWGRCGCGRLIGTIGYRVCGRVVCYGCLRALADTQKGRARE